MKRYVVLAAAAVAKAVDLSVSHLHLLFRTQLGESPHQYLIRKRLRIAGHALATSKQSIKAVAAEVGYTPTRKVFAAPLESSSAARRRTQ